MMTWQRSRFVWNPSFLALLFAPGLLAPGLLALSCVLGFDEGLQAEEDMRIRLKDDSFAQGKLVPCEDEGFLGWRHPAFTQELQFDIRALRSVTLLGQGKDVELEGRTVFELTEGEVILGKWEDMTAKQVLVQSDILGPISIDRKRILAISDAVYQGDLIYRGPSDDGAWNSVAEDLSWDFEAGALTTDKQGATVLGNVNLPRKAEVKLVLTWQGVPDFVVSLGTSKSAGAGPVDTITAAARLEVWDKQLAIVREVDGGADIALVSDLTESNPRIELSLYIDQVEGVVSVFDAHGRPLDTVSAKSDNEELLPCIHIVHHGSGMSLENLEVREWDGISTAAIGDQRGFVARLDGEVLDASVDGFDAETGMLTLKSLEDGTLSQLPIREMRRGLLTPVDVPGSEGDGAAEADAGPESDSPAPAEPSAVEQGEEEEFEDLFATPDDNEPDTDEEQESASEEAEAGEIDPATIVEIVLSDRSRIRGEWLTAKNDLLRIRSPGVQTVSPDGDLEFLAFSTEKVNGVIGANDRFDVPETEQRKGALKLDNLQIDGYLAPDSPEGSETALLWRPLTSPASYEISSSASGAIVYRKRLPKVKVSQRQSVQPKRAAPMLNIFLGGRARAAEASDETSSSETRELLFRTGDGIQGEVLRIDEQGVYFASEQTTTDFAKHEQMQSVAINDQRSLGNTSPAKMERLMTVPRSMKSDPPTHLFIAINGDYLRGRLIQLADGVLTVEVRLEILEIPVKQVAQIVWLHDREWDEKSEAAQGGEENEQAEPELVADTLPFSVHGIAADDSGLSFTPLRTVDSVIHGQSELLGECSINANDVNQILFGRDIGDSVREFRENPWILALAQYPRVFDQSDEPNDPAAGMQSDLVGQQAPNIYLDTLDGEKFSLKKAQDRVVVLDFWASWCGPCVQTMPLVEEAIQEIGEDRVHLVAINIQESPERVARAVDSLEIEATVALDIDGEIASAYQANAIPQTVVIDKTGKITHVFVGGGARTVAQLKQAILQVLGDIPPGEGASTSEAES